MNYLDGLLTPFSPHAVSGGIHLTEVGLDEAMTTGRPFLVAGKYFGDLKASCEFQGKAVGIYQYTPSNLTGFLQATLYGWQYLSGRPRHPLNGLHRIVADRNTGTDKGPPFVNPVKSAFYMVDMEYFSAFADPALIDPDLDRAILRKVIEFAMAEISDG